ncbi:Nn.00g088990.m01.CDS01 [Neocucurbitaria sp. VM-36]
MLSYPDRYRFEEIRARWETAQPTEVDASNMVGRREAQTIQQSMTDASQSNGGSRFRRKLSHGLAFIGNPLSQRKTTPGRHQSKPPPVVISEPATTGEPVAVNARDTLLPLRRNSTPAERGDCSPTKQTIPADNRTPTKSEDPDSTLTLLPRARTISFIPRPVRSESGLFVPGVEGPIKPEPPAVMADPKPRVISSKIPTPSPPLSERRRYSPGQYTPRHSSQHAEQTAAIPTLVKESNGSPVELAGRPRPTPNLVKSITSPRLAQSASFMASNKTGLKKPATSPRIQRPVLQENVPTSKQITQRRSQTQEKTLEGDSLQVSRVISNKRTFGQGGPPGQRNQNIFATPPPARKRLSVHLAQQQTPVTAKRVLSKVQVNPHVGEQSEAGLGGAIAQTRLMRPRSPPTPTVGHFKLPLPRLSTEKDLQRKTLGTPNGLGGVWRSSRALAMSNHEVRRVPRSFTFHDFGTQWEPTPPVPPIPEHYRTPSLSDLTQYARMDPGTPIRPRLARMVSNATSCESIPEETNEDESHSNIHSMPSQNTPRQLPTSEHPPSTVDHTAVPLAPAAICSSDPPQSAPRDDPEAHPAGNQNQRPWSISEQHFPDSADISPFLQVKDYMPPLYWAGRFQSRFDQWRTEAVTAQLNPSHEPTGPLGECKLDQEKLAACYIFAQLRDLCTSNQAADSLWAFEFKYRKDNKLLENPLDIPDIPSRKDDDHSHHKGAFGRAVRKLTPRKTSLVNLLKGKGWNKGDERANDGSENVLERSSDSS